MQLMTRELEERFRQVGRQEAKRDDAIVVAKYFTPDGIWTWWATEYDPVERVIFGLAKGFETELGYSSLDEMEGVRGPLGLPIERDLYWRETTLAHVKRDLADREAA